MGLSWCVFVCVWVCALMWVVACAYVCMVNMCECVQAHIIAYLCLMIAYLLLLIQCLKYKGPSGKEMWFNGYREQNMLGV